MVVAVSIGMYIQCIFSQATNTQNVSLTHSHTGTGLAGGIIIGAALVLLVTVRQCRVLKKESPKGIATYGCVSVKCGLGASVMWGPCVCVMLKYLC